MKRSCAFLFATAAFAIQALAAGPIALPIYIEDNHAGSFYWLAENLDLDEEHTLLLFDAHSDASGIFDSDVIRRQVRRVASREDRRRLLDRWREKGTVQCFSWIEPLMPSPIADVIWVPPNVFTIGEKQGAGEEAGDFLDGHLEAAPRAAGPLRNRVTVSALDEVRAQIPSERPIVVSIDLDYFAGLPPAERGAAFERIWAFVAELRNLRAITIAISRPYLRDDEEADALVLIALRASLSLPTATIQFEPFQTVANDRSARALEYRAQKRKVPNFDVARASPALRALLLGNDQRIAVHKEKARWKTLLQEWRQAAPTFRVSIKDRQPSTDHVWRLPATARAEIELQAEPWYTPVAEVQWIAEVPRYLRCNLIATNEAESGFAQGAPPRPRCRDVILPESGQTIPLTALREFFDQKTECGSVRIRARVLTADWIRETPAIEIRRFTGTGFRAALTEQFGLPYLFGGGSLRGDGGTGPETGWGADCANFLVYALRRQGQRIPWSNPKQFRQHLEPIAERAALENRATFTSDELERGVVLHLGTHVAALMEDQPPVGVLDATDIVAHQLEGAPALLSVAELLQSRETKRFDLLRVPPARAADDLVIGGDVMLGRTVGEQIKDGVDPFSAIRAVFESAGITAVNLECVVSDKGEASPEQRFHLRAPVEAAETISKAGIDVVGMANNHAADFGVEGLLDSMERLRSAGLTVLSNGSAHTQKSPSGSEPTKRVCFIAIDDTGSARSSSQAAALVRSIEKARAEADFVVALPHWGEENTTVVTERQRELARWLVEHGVDLVAGSHPHCIQPLDFYRGRPIAYSLGNLVFDGAPSVSSWNQGQLLKVGLGDRRGATPSLELLPIKLDGRGFPQLSPPHELTQR